MRHPLLHGLYPANLGTDYTATFDVWVLLFMAFILVTLACLVFGEEDHLGRILLVESPRPKKAPRSWKKRDRNDSPEMASVPARPTIADD
jgi:hypothetical protein